MSEYENGYDAAIAACERQVNELAEIKQELVEVCYMAIPFLEDLLDDKGYKDGVVKRALYLMQLAIQKAEQQ